MRCTPLRLSVSPSLRLSVSCLAYQPQLGLLPDPTANPNMLPAGRLEMLQVLLQGRVIELGQELGLNVDVEATDIVDDLTFVHG